MNVRVDQLAPVLQRGLAPSYVVYGDEPLQREEALDTIRQAARSAGVDERIVLHAETGFDWGTLTSHNAAMSLFAERRLIDLRLPNSRPGKEGGQTLRDYVANPNPDNTLLISFAKVDYKDTTTKWFKEIAAASVVVQVWPITGRHLSGWIQRRAQTRELKLTPAAANSLADRTEGNLLACAQEIDKWLITFGAGATIDDDAALASVGVSARYGVFDLADTVLTGDANRSLRILKILREEGIDAIIINWALAREVRTLAKMAAGFARGTGRDEVVAQHRIRRNRIPSVIKAMERHSPERLHGLLAQAARVDRATKGGSADDPWGELEKLVLGVCGKMILATDTL